MHGLEPQTIESLNLLRARKTPFIIALNKVDRIYDWKPVVDAPFRTSLATQAKHCQLEFDKRCKARERGARRHAERARGGGSEGESEKGIGARTRTHHTTPSPIAASPPPLPPLRRSPSPSSWSRA